MRSDTITLSLKCPFSAEKLREMADKLTRAINTREEIEEEKKASNAAFKSRLEECEKEIVPLARAYAKSYEMADVACDIRYNDPDPGKKTYYRMDTKEAVETHDMSWEEKQEEIQFNLPQTDPAPSADDLDAIIGDTAVCAHPSVSNLDGSGWKCDACREMLADKPGERPLDILGPEPPPTTKPKEAGDAAAGAS